MAVTFPSSPTNGQQLTANGKTYTYSSASGAWNITGADNPIDILFTRSEFISTADQTTFSVTYNIDYPIEVFVNGLQYLASDYTATNGTSVVFNTGLPADAEVVIMYATSSLNTIPDDISDLTDTANIIPADISDLTDTTGALSSGGGVTVYSTIDDLPMSGNSNGDLALVSSTNRLYLFTNSGWYSIALINQTPTITGNEASYVLASDGTATIVTLTGTDPEGMPITWSAVTSGDTNIATVTNVDNVFTITPSTDTADQGTLTITFSASDGVNIGTATSEFTLSYLSPLRTNLAMSIGTSATNGLDNSTFIDRSTNALTVTGTPTQTAFHPYLDNWSVEFDGAGDFLDFDAASVEFDLGANDFTVECWVNFNDTSEGCILSKHTTATAHWLELRLGSSNKILTQVASGTSWTVSYSSTSSVEIGNWYHIALVREGNTFTTYIDGQSEGTATNSLTISNNTSYPLRLGARGGEDDPLNGSISNLRLIKGTALYTTDFAPPTEKLTAVSGTSLLTCQSNRFIDNSTSTHEITVNGGPAVSASSPFGQESEYVLGENKGSAYFNGSSTQLNVAHDGTDLDLRDNPFTIECWVYANSFVDTPTIFSQSDASNDVQNLRFDTNGNLYVQYYVSGSNRVLYTSSGTTAKIGQWHHVALVCDGDASNTSRVYLDGEQLLSWTDPYNWGDGAYPYDFAIGYFSYTNVRYLDGYISDFRITNGTARYTSNFSVPTAPVGNTDATLYLPFDNAGVFDKTGNNTLTVIGNTSTATTQTKFADTAIYFDGSGDVIRTNLNEIYNIGTNDFTVEFWVYPSSWSSSNWDTIFSIGQGTNFGGLLLGKDTSENFVIRQYGTASRVSTATLPPVNTWTHVACVRSSGTSTIYYNGASIASASDASNYNTATPYAHIGNSDSTTYPHYFNGYIENLQMLPNVAKYTANFTVPEREQGQTYQAES